MGIIKYKDRPQRSTAVIKLILNSAFWVSLIFLFFYSSVHGIGISPDSISFLSDGSVFAPLYNYILLLISDGIIDGAQKAKYLNLIFYINSSLLLYVIIRYYSQSNLTAIISTSAFALNKYVIDMYLLVHNEALALFLTTLFFYLITKYLQEPKKAILLAASIIAGLIPPSRYAFSFTVIAGGIFFLFHPGFNKYKRIINTVQYFIISVSITLLTFILSHRISLSKNQVGGREFAFNGNADMDRYLQGFSSLSNMFFPTTFGKTFTIIVAMTIIILIIITLHESHSQNRIKENLNRIYFGKIILINSLLYALLLIISVQIEANLPLYGRYMVPFILFFALTAGISFNWHELPNNAGPKKAAILALAIIVLYFPANLLRTAKYVVNTHKKGMGYASIEWKQSPTVNAVKTIEYEKDAIILTNGPDVMQFLVGIKATCVPPKFSRRTGKDYSEPYEERVHKTRQRIISKGAYYIHFNKIDWRFYLPTKEEIQTIYQFYPFIETKDGIIFKADAIKKE